MKTCIECGNTLLDGQVFCGKCGTPVPKEDFNNPGVVCKKCGMTNEPGSAFCAGCGNRIESDVQQPVYNNVMGQDTQPINVYQNNMVNNQGMEYQQYNVVEEKSIDEWNSTSQEMYTTESKKKKSKKKPIIISLVIVFVLILGLCGGYLFLTFTEQKSVDKKYDELQNFIDDNEVKLTEDMEDEVDDLSDDMDSFNYFELKKLKKKISKKLEEIKEYDKVMDDAESAVDKYNEELEAYNDQALDMDVTYECSYVKEDCEYAIESLQSYIDERNTREFKDAQAKVQSCLDEYKGKIADVVEERIGEFQSDYEDYVVYSDKLKDWAKEAKVTKDENVKAVRAELDSALTGFKDAIDKSDFENIALYRSQVNEYLYNYEDAIEVAISNKTVITVEYETDLEYIIPEVSYEIISEDYFDRIEDLKAKEKLMLCILARNEIYARYGAYFNAESLNEYFVNRIWYYNMDISSSDSDLTATIQSVESEKENIETLKKLQEKYEKKYGKTGVKATEFTAEEYEEALATYNMYRKVGG